MSESVPVPYRIYITPETIEELNDAASATGKESGNKVAASVVTDCLEVWLALQKSLKHHRGEFLRQVVSEIESGQGQTKRKS